MGRGRQKAKHTKVARELKYYSPNTNYSALESELSGGQSNPRLEEDLDKWSEYVVDDDEDEGTEDEFEQDGYGSRGESKTA